MTETSSFKLIIEDDEGRRSVVPVDLGEVSIGRLDGNTIRLNERNVSRRHARLFKEASNVVAEDLDSYNGVYINGDRVKGRREVRDGDVLRIGDFQLELRGEGLPSRTNETTQRTNAPDAEATQPDIRVTGGAPASPAKPASEENPEPRPEPTAIIRTSHLEDVEAARRDNKAIIAGQKAKIACVSTQYAGRDFEIGKTEMVIGRTPDNDIAIDHRSVSRHHAKIVVMGKSYKVIDLKSANGTLVNGEEYAQVDLKRGDLIEFGHVKFRFVPPGEDYAFTPEEAAAIQKGGRDSGGAATPGAGGARRETSLVDLFRSNQLLVIAIGALAVAILVMIVWLLATGGDDQAKAPPGPTPPIGPVPAPTSEVEKLVARANAAMVQRNFQQAATLARAALAMEPENAPAQETVSRADAEAEAQQAYDAAVAAINSNNWSLAWSRLQEIPDKSVFAPQAALLMPQVKGALVTEKVTDADRAVANGEVETAEQLTAEIGALEPGRADVARLQAAITKARAEAQSHTITKARGKAKEKAKGGLSPGGGTTPAIKPPEANGGGATGEDPKPIYTEGTKALTGGNYQKAIDLFNRCTRADPKFCLCYRALGISYAKSGNGPKAYRYYKQYLKTCPTAADAPQVEQLLKQYEQAQ
ncbi:MAG: FHA domain-containing protein [Deltaproteobacteria bacterium]|nr:FHA domain-containing protein [Deltaproteobacteria bacterium]